MLQQLRFAAHREAAECAGEDDFLPLRHVAPLRLNQVVEEDQGHLGPVTSLYTQVQLHFIV